ncbi:MAG: helix-turn-helix transcriptional regulator, partial [Leptotrichiaceae bacterium]|nr:helix-turn-helix transcriptional regulator [Leptotrichiaceae bacterium]
SLKTVYELISKWYSEISDIFKVDECIIEKADAEIETLAFQVCNIPLTEINDYFQFKTKIIQLFYLILKKFSKSPSSTDVEKYSDSITSEKIKSVINTYPLSEIPTIKELCKIMKVSNYYFQLAFKNSEGISVKQYILNLKMNHAKFLLETTNYSIFDISIEVGYENPSKFAKTFKNYFGIFPSKYRKNFQQ